MNAVDAPKRALIVFIKSPMAGNVKTRLIPHLSAEEAANLYRCFVLDVLKSLLPEGPDGRLIVAYQPSNKMPDLSWTGRHPPEFFRQEGKSLGERLAHAFGTAFGRGCRQVVLIGSDSPTLPPAYIEQAFAALQEADVVVGPATDGGYYLIGLSRPCLKLFDDVAWSTDQVFERTVQIAQSQGFRLRVLPTHYDVDTVDDLGVLSRELAANDAVAPQTRRYLTQLIKSKPPLVAVS